MSSDRSSTNNRRVWVRRLAPWIITGVVVGLLLHQYPVDRIVDEMRAGTFLPLLPLGLGMAVVVLLMVGIWDGLILRAVLGPMRYLEIIAGKASTSVLVVLNPTAAGGAYGVWIARKTGSDVRTTVGVVLYIMLCDLAALALFMSLAIWISGVQLPASRQALQYIAPGLSAVLIGFALLGPRLARRLIRDPRMLRSWTVVSGRRYLTSLLGRVFMVSLFVPVTWVAARAFGMPLPLYAVATYMPLILFVGALPINIGGFGAVQAVWLLFTPWAPGEQILAFQFLWRLCLVGGLIVRGVPFLRGVLREIADGPPADTRAAAPPAQDG